MVFDANMSGINVSLWYPNLMLPVIGSLLMIVGPEMHMVDIDVGDMFYNFRISPVLEKYCGMDLGPYMGHKSDQKRTPLWTRWVCPIMGFVLSPYSSIQCLLWESEVVWEDGRYPGNTFRCYKVRMNLPGDPYCSPTLAWIPKFVGETQEFS